MKKLVAFILCMALVITCVACFAACNPKEDDDFSVKQYDYDAISDTCTSADGKYEVAFVTTSDNLKINPSTKELGKDSRDMLTRTAKPISIINLQTVTKPPTQTDSML